MKIDFIIGALSGGGAERVMVLLATEMAKKHNVTIITFAGHDEYKVSNAVKRVELNRFSIKNHTIRRYLELLKYYKIKKNRPNVLISFLPTISLISIPVGKVYCIKTICCEHINYLQVENAAVSFTRKYLYRLANALTVLTSFDKEYYEKKGVNTIVMPNPCTFEIFGENVVRNKELIAVGNLDRFFHKGFDNLINLINPILKKYPEWKLRIIGSGTNGKIHLENLVYKNNLQNQVIFDGFRNDIHKIMQGASIFVLTSRFEGLPMVLLEAMSQGMACISYNCITGPSEIIVNGMNGILVPDQNKKLIQQEIVKLIENKNLREALGREAIKSLDRYSMKNIIKRWGLLLSSIQE